jgi:fluoride exporter
VTVQRVWLAVALGGGLGTIARALLNPGLFFGEHPQLWITLVVNLVGAALLGLALGHGLPHTPEAIRHGITTGFLGSFTTFSAITAAWLSLTLDGGAIVGAAYFLGTFVAGVLVAWAGLRLGLRWRGVRPKAVGDDG